MAVQIQHRRDTAATWASSNPILASGEMGIETDTKYFKIGDGATLWTNLPYGGMSATSPIIGTGINTASTTFNVVNTIAASINMGGAATALNFGASVGTFSVGNPVLSINGTNPSIRSTNTGAATIFPANVSGVTIGYGSIPVTLTGSTGFSGLPSPSGVTATPGGLKFENDGSVQYFTPNSGATNGTTAYGGRGVMETSHWAVLYGNKSMAATTTTTNVIFATAASPLTAGTLAVATNTAYAVEMYVSWTSGATSHTTTFSFVAGGSATFDTSTLYTQYNLSAVGTAATVSAVVTNGNAGTTPATPALATTTTTAGTVLVKGIIRISSSPSGTGTIAPTITFSAGTGTIPVILAGSYIKLTPISSTYNAIFATGAWA